MPKVSTRSLSTAALALSFITLISTNIYFASSSSNEITGCVNKKTGALRIASKCSTSEKPISWNKIGPQGIPGPQGLTGETGTVGLQGLKGEKGIDGLIGPVGLTGPQGPGGVGISGAQGPAGSVGPQGPAGRQLVVRDSTGTLVGYLIGTLNIFTGFNINPELTPASNFIENAVQVWDPVAEAKFVYDFSGRPLTSYVVFSGANCTGNAYIAGDGEVGDFIVAPKYVAFADSPTGVIRWYQPATSTYVDGIISIASGSRYTNNCRAGSDFGDATFSGNIAHVALNPISSPIPTIVGPLRIALN
jgi:hypothetical protein